MKIGVERVRGRAGEGKRSAERRDSGVRGESATWSSGRCYEGKLWGKRQKSED